MALNPFLLVRKIDSLLQLEARHGESLRALNAEMASLRDRIMRLETRDEVLISRAEGAAATAAAMATSSSMTDLARRIGVLEATNQLSLPGKRR